MESKILLLIDDPRLNEPLAKELEKLSYQFSYPEGDVMRKVFDEVPHLIIVDEDFRNGRGRRLALSIKEDLVLKYIPIILLVKENRIFQREHNGVIDYYFEKNQDMEKLVTCVQETLRKNYHELDLSPLTHLPGTRSSVLRIERAIHSKEPFAVCCIDLSNLAAYNQSYGDVNGDKVIVRVGQIIEEVIKRLGTEDDFVGHLGGDDFIVVTQSALAVSIAEALIEHFDAVIPNFYKSGDKDQMALAIVIIPNENIPASEINEIGRIAGELNKSMKTLPGSCYIKYRPRLQGTPEEGHEPFMEVQFPGEKKSVRVAGPDQWENKHTIYLKSAIEDKQIQTLYQPIVELRSTKIIGYEALTRTTEEKLFNDMDILTLFIMARESGRVKELDEVCVECALRSAQNLNPNQKLFINLNHETLIDEKVMKDLFKNRGVIDFKNIVIEVTEQSILRSFGKIREALLGLKEKGVSVAIDDLGGGAVSLRDVAVLRPDYIKFDRSLIRQIDTSITKQQIVLSLILFANGIQATTTAEGIETKRELDTAVMLGVMLGQGYYFARPSPPFTQLLA